MEGTNLIIVVAGSLVSGFVLATIIFLTVYSSRSHGQVRSEVGERTDQFISLASHYLLNPITVIQTALATLQEKDTELTTEKRNTLYDAIERGQQRLWIVTQQMMTVGEVDQQTLRLQLAVANIYDMVSAAAAGVDPFAREKKVSIHIEDRTQEMREARFDFRRMKQVMIAVLDNAVKFSLEGGKIRVVIMMESGYFTIWVEDQGIGMPDSILSHVTEKFYRGNEVYTFDYEGLGLGLYIAQAIVRLHQGNITFTSKEKRGTAVAVQFPMA